MPLLSIYSFAKIQKNSPRLFFPLLLHGTTRSIRFDWLFVSHKAITGIPTLFASTTAFLSGHESVTSRIFASLKISSLGFVSIPGGYLPAMQTAPVSLPNARTDFHPFSLLLTMSMSSGAYCDMNLEHIFILSSIFCRFKTERPSDLVL